MATIVTRAGKGSALTNTELDANFTNINTELGQKEVASNRNASGGYAGLSAFNIQLRNNANTFTNLLASTSTAARTHTFQDKDYTIAGTNDTFNLGTTALTLNRASGAVVLTGITSIDGYAATLNTAGNYQLNSLGAGTAGSGTAGEIRATNNITAYYSSDERLKTNVQQIQNAVRITQALRGVFYDWTEEYIASRGGEDGYFIRKNDLGVIAQDVEKVLPQLVATNNEGYKAVRYDRLVALLIEAVKELADNNNKLHEENRLLYINLKKLSKASFTLEGDMALLKNQVSSLLKGE